MSPLPPLKKMRFYTSREARGYLCPEVQLEELRARLAAGWPLERAAAIMPVYVGGPLAKGPPLGAVAEGPWVENMGDETARVQPQAEGRAESGAEGRVESSS